FIGRWPELVERAVRLFGGGLGERSEQDEIVLLNPKAWGQARFDLVRQEVVRPIFDADDRPLLLVLPHTPKTAEAVKAIEEFQPAGPQPLLGLLRLHADRFIIEPVAIYVGDEIFNLTFDIGDAKASKRSQRATQTEAAIDEDADDVEEEELLQSSSPLGLLL